MKGKNSRFYPEGILAKLNNSRFRSKVYTILVLALILIIWCLFETKPALAQETSKESLTSVANVVPQQTH